MRLAPGLDIAVPHGWNIAAQRRDTAERHLLVHAATVPLPRERGDYGSGVISTLGPDDVFVSLVDHGREGVGTALFASRGLPAPKPSEFEPNAMQRVHLGMSGGQWFFTAGGRAWCLYAVLGSHARRQHGAVKVNTLLKGVRIG